MGDGNIFEMLQRPAPSFLPAEDSIGFSVRNGCQAQRVTDKQEVKHLLLFQSSNVTVPL